MQKNIGERGSGRGWGSVDEPRIEFIVKMQNKSRGVRVLVGRSGRGVRGCDQELNLF